VIYSLGLRTIETESNQFYVAPSANLIGNVRLGNHASIWWNAVLRADNEPITIGKQTNVQDGCILHTDPGFPIEIGANVSIGHLCMLHGCVIGDGSLVGIGSIILNGAKVGKNCLIGANSLITEGKIIPENSLIMGSPGKVIRQVNDNDLSQMRHNVRSYVKRSKLYHETLKPSKI
jgi:carbonic anhydrase/acetyltransferase-like protein (isoleucine patch superfamily)